MQSILFRSDIPAPDLLTADLWEHGTTGILDDGGALRAFFDDSLNLQPLLEKYAAFVVETRLEQPLDLQQFERNDWDGIFVGKQFFVAPSWIGRPVPPGRIHLAIDSTLAFGTGRHESSQLAIEALEQHLRPGATVLDVGCGSGILSVAASLLEAGSIASCDIDENAVTATRERVQSPVFLGSADAVRSAFADLVVANITVHVLDALAYDLNRVAKPDGHIVMTGFMRDNPPRKWRPINVLERGDWLCWICLPDHSLSAPEQQYRPKMDWW